MFFLIFHLPAHFCLSSGNADSSEMKVAGILIRGEISDPASRAFNAAFSVPFRFDLAIDRIYKYKEIRPGYKRSPRHLTPEYQNYTIFRIKTRKI